jgi:hypothetical protein
MARISGTGTLTAAGDTTTDSTAQDRSVRTRVFNKDTVQHKYTYKIGTDEQEKVTLQADEGHIFGPDHVANGTSVVINVAEATTTNASKFGKTGEYDA